MEIDYSEIIERVKARLTELKGRRGSLELEKADVEAEIDALSDTMRAVAPMVDTKEEQKIKEFLGSLGETSSPVGITDRIRSVLRTTLADQLSPAEVRDALQSSGWDLGRYANAVSTIHTVLKRLEKSGEAIEIQTPEGKKFRRVKK